MENKGLTPKEIAAIRKCKYFGAHWGQVNVGLCPAATVAQMRGAVFNPVEGFYSLAGNSEIAFQAVQDITDWLCLRDRYDFYDILDIEGSEILNRAPKE